MGPDLISQTSPTLLGRLRQDPNDEKAWQSFVARYGPKIYGWCKQWRLQDMDAEDVTQNVLLGLTRRGSERTPARGRQSRASPQRGVPAAAARTTSHHDDSGESHPEEYRAGAAGEGLPRIDGYRVLGVLGRGGMGVVYKAEQLALRRLVALKMIRGRFVAETGSRSRSTARQGRVGRARSWARRATWRRSN